MVSERRRPSMNRRGQPEQASAMFDTATTVEDDANSKLGK